MRPTARAATARTALRATPDELANLRARLAEAEETLEAIRSGNIDALLVHGPDGEQVYTLASADRAFRELAERMTEGAATIAGDGTILWANTQLATLLTWPLQRLVGVDVLTLAVDGEAAAFTALLERGRTGSVNDEVDLARPDGSRVSARLSVSPVTSGDETARALVISDLTQHKRNEAFLRGSLDAMLDSFVVCSAVRDETGTIVNFHVDFANRAAGTAMERSAETLIGEAIPGMMPPLGDTSFRDVVRRVVETGERWGADPIEIVVPRRDGRLKPLTVSIQVVKFGDGFFVTWRDVSEREAGRADRERLATAIEQMAESVVITDRDATILYVNPAFERVSGYSAAEVVGRNPRLLQSGVQEPASYRQMWSALGAGETWVGEFVNRRKDGSTFVEEASISPIIDSRGGHVSFVGVKRDVTLEREIKGGLVLEANVRDRLALTMLRLSSSATAEQIATAVCDELATIPGIDFTAVFAFSFDEEVAAVAHSAPAGFPPSPSPRSRLLRAMRQRADAPWAATWDPTTWGPETEDETWVRALTGMGIRAMAFGPIVHGGHADGMLVMGTCDPVLARTLVQRMPEIGDFSNTPSALLAAGLHARRQHIETRAALAAVMADGTFHPVFQPIIDLESRETMGFEALTRFDSGQRPDLCFADAWSVGLGAELEIATLEAAVAAAKGLPPGLWLNLNFSPRLLADPERLRSVLWTADRPIVLEITEHELIADYDAVRDAIAGLGHDVRLAVDDAGSGVANFGHIIDLRPDFVKLDIGLVRRVNANLGRQAMVVGMRHFSRTAGCRLIAEGIETPEEARTLTALGVEFGQGYLLGRPEPVESWVGGLRARLKPTDPGSGGPTDAMN